MRMRTLFHTIFGLSAIAIIAAGCGGGESRLTPTEPLQSAFSSGTNALAIPPELDGVSKILSPGHGRSWMAPDAKRHKLLYVADYGNNVVDALSYPKGKLVGSLAIDGGSEGVCVDKKNNVWITAVHTQQFWSTRRWHNANCNAE